MQHGSSNMPKSLARLGFISLFNPWNWHLHNPVIIGEGERVLIVPEYRKRLARMRLPVDKGNTCVLLDGGEAGMGWGWGWGAPLCSISELGGGGWAAVRLWLHMSIKHPELLEENQAKRGGGISQQHLQTPLLSFIRDGIHSMDHTDD